MQYVSPSWEDRYWGATQTKEYHCKAVGHILHTSGLRCAEHTVNILQKSEQCKFLTPPRTTKPENTVAGSSELFNKQWGGGFFIFYFPPFLQLKTMLQYVKCTIWLLLT